MIRSRPPRRPGQALIHGVLAAGVREVGLAVVLILVAGGLWLFVELSEGVVAGSTHAVDRAILLALREAGDPGDPIGPGWLEEVGRDVTALGSLVVLVSLATAVVVFLALRGQRRAAVFVAVAVAGGVALGFALKLGFERPRPDLVPHAATVYTASYPSAHSMMSAVVYLTLGTLLARMQPNRILKLYVMTLAVLTAVAVGVSRVYLGVHWPTDVLAGWIAGAVWAMLCWSLVLWLQRRSKVEATPDDAGDRASGAAARGAEDRPPDPGRPLR